MYLVYSQKEKGAKQRFPLNTQIKFLSYLFANQCWILSLPGHLSSKARTEDYLKQFNSLLNYKKIHKEQFIGFGSGYASQSKREDYIRGIDQLKMTDPGFALRNYNVVIRSPYRSNHSKMLFYYQWKDKKNVMSDFTAKGRSLSQVSLCEFLPFIEVNAVIIGSSNQSYSSLFSKYADKGESDIMLLASGYQRFCFKDDKDILADILDYHRFEREYDLSEDITIANDVKEFFDKNIISKTLLPIEGKTDEEYLKQVFEKCLGKELG